MSNEQEAIMTDEHLREVVENQIADGDPIKVKETLMRLMMTGHSREDAIDMIACALMLEVFGVMKNDEAFNLKRYKEHLDELPQMSWLEDE
ncbi:hypothetical protein VINI7043_25147 [Vibrio nigripulchritudo ATCC 27043]|uniref:Uncharacterized protein n=2 Tax=Vibrio nigripulchritudo TaxID=28173 RepID=U4KGR8_9VIBR|nr:MULTISPECIES: hypothetical protein [Vibrio]EGU60551.1 hypothetical protein VINI7043_25147 [Vibrio nigripulchritudo ATCC 27043]KJY74673.1 hypothetical protein TW74_18290 [Vibrio nigripulchritudo]UAB73988.1 hypothetical protein INR79_22905 [Vibrio sp. SCSIO 43132]CCN34008.1 conserved hypothetical protein [Vibrio nigripulchritudo AM115]CCN40010.1 conserved hypothetical protein [Vibrio nigripulchritudo FTn2]